ncbi:MAG: adenylate/guanylate cyclase domain-containing protein [Thermoproteota archaeon]
MTQYDALSDLPMISFQDERAESSYPSCVVSFSGKQQECCVCCIDIVGSTKVAAGLGDKNAGRYYEIFLNSVATIASNFGAIIIKNVGDSLLYYFPRVSDPHVDKRVALDDALQSSVVMADARAAINARMAKEGLPPVSYRISSDYGSVYVAKSFTSNIEDLFGSTMNLCAKLNSRARPNGIVIGKRLYDIVLGFEGYSFVEAGEYALDASGQAYRFYELQGKSDTKAINPFRRTGRLGRMSAA